MLFDIWPRNLIALPIVLLIVSSPPTLVRAQTVPSLGTQVLIKDGATLKVGEQIVDTGKSQRIYKVERSNGDWLWLVSGTATGWARSADVIPLDRAIALYTAEIKRNPHVAWPRFNRGIIYQVRQDIDKALFDFTEAIRQEPDYVPALINRGNVWLMKRSFERAITDYDEAIRLEPTAVLAHLNRGIAWQSKGDFDKALTDYDEAIRLGLKKASTYNNRGQAREMKQDHDGAIADYSEAIRLDPGYALAWNNRGSAWQFKGEYEKALADFSEVTRVTPQSPWGYARRAWILATCPEAKYRDGKEAVELALKACELSDSKDATFLDVRAAAYAEVGEFAKAVYWQTRAMMIVPRTATKEAESYRARLKVYQEQKPYREER